MRDVLGFGDNQPDDIAAAFAGLMLRSHRVVVRADVLYGGEVLDVTVPLVDGQVDYDRGAARLARASVRIADPVRLPLGSDDVYTPFGYELRLWRGVGFPGRYEAPTFVAAGTAAADIIAVTPSLPSGIAPGDVLLLVAESANEAMTISDANAGTWTQVDQGGTGSAGSTGATRLAVWWSTYNGTQGAPTIADPGNHCVAQIVAFRGVHPTKPISDVSSVTTDTGPDTFTFPPATTRARNSMVVLVKADDFDSASTTRYASWTNANLASVTEAVDTGTASGNGGGLGLAYGVKVDAGSTGSSTVAQNTNITVDAALTIALAPSVPADSYAMVPLGTFPILDSNLDGVSLLTSLTLEDRSFLVSMARFEDDYQVAAGTNYATAIEDLIDDGVSGLEYLFPSTTYTTPLLTFSAMDDRWQAAQSMASSIGMDLFFDGLGRVVMRPEPTFATDPVYAIAEASNLVAINVGLSRRPAVNRVIASSANASLTDQYRGVATDDDPASPTYYDGPFGAQVEFFASPLLASDAQCETAAATILARKLGIAASLDFAALPDPRLEPGDVVTVTRDALGIDQDVHIIETLSIGLGPESAMSGTTRTRQVTT